MNKNTEIIQSIFGAGSYATRMYVNRGRFWFACKETYKFSKNRGELKILKPASVLKSLFSQNNINSDYANVLALQFNEESRYGIIDIDSNSKYKNEAFIDKLYSVCDDLDINAIRLRSSNSNGWHILFPFSDKMSSLVIYKLIASIAYLSGVKNITNGQCEVYPNPARKSQKVRLPGQIEQIIIDMNFEVPLSYEVGNNFTFMNHKEKIKALDTIFNSKFYSNDKLKVENIIKDKISKNKWYLFNKKASSEFLDELNETEEQFNKRVSGSKKLKNGVVVNYYKGGSLPEIKLNLEIVKNYNSKREEAANFFNDLGYAGINLFNRGVDYYKNGIIDFGTRLDALISIGYALYFAGYSAEEREVILINWMKEKNNGKSKDWLKKPDFVISQIKELCFWNRSINNPESFRIEFVKNENSHYIAVAKKEAFDKKCAKQLESNRLARALSVNKIYCLIKTLDESSFEISVANMLKISDVGRATIYRVKDSFNAKDISELINNELMIGFIEKYDTENNLYSYRKEMREIFNKNIIENSNKLNKKQNSSLLAV